MADDTTTSAPQATFDAPPWEDVAPQFKQSFPDLDEGMMKERYEQTRSLAAARQNAAENPDSATYRYLGMAMPLAPTLQHVDYARAKSRMLAGNPEPQDYHLMAQYEANQQKNREEAEGSRGAWLGQTGARLAGMLGEFYMAGGATEAAATLPGLGFLAPAGTTAGQAGIEASTVAVPKFFSAAGLKAAAAHAATEAGVPMGLSRGALATAGANLGRTAATTAAVPSLYADRWVDQNLAAGRDATDIRGLPSAYGLGLAQMSALKATAAFTQPILPYPGIGQAAGRVALQAGIGPATAAATDVATSALDDTAKGVLGTSAGLHTGYGTLGQLARGEYKEAGQHLATEAITFAAFGLSHEVQGGPRADRQLVDSLRKLARRGVPVKQAIEAMADPGKLVQQVLEANPAAGRADIEAAMQDLPEGPIRDYGMALAGSLPEVSPPAEPAPTPESPPSSEETPTQPESQPAAPPQPPVDQSGVGTPTFPANEAVAGSGVPGYGLRELPVQPSAPPPQSAPVPGGKGLEAIGGMGKGILDSMYAGLFDSLQKGKDTFAGVRDPILARAKPFFERGLIKTPEDLQKLANADFDPVKAGILGKGKLSVEDAQSLIEGPGQHEIAAPETQQPEIEGGKRDWFGRPIPGTGKVETEPRGSPDVQGPQPPEATEEGRAAPGNQSISETGTFATPGRGKGQPAYPGPVRPETYNPNRPSQQQIDAAPFKPFNETVNRGRVGTVVIAGKKWLYKGTANHDATLAELRTPKIMRLAGLNAPETHEVNAGNKPGSEQGKAVLGQWINGKKLEYKYDIDRHKLEPAQRHELERHAVFNFLTGSEDRHGGNYLIDEHGRVWAIDHEQSLFPRSIDLDPGNPDSLFRRRLTPIETAEELTRSPIWTSIVGDIGMGAPRSAKLAVRFDPTILREMLARVPAMADYLARNDPRSAAQMRLHARILERALADGDTSFGHLAEIAQDFEHPYDASVNRARKRRGLAPLPRKPGYPGSSEQGSTIRGNEDETGSILPGSVESSRDRPPEPDQLERLGSEGSGIDRQGIRGDEASSTGSSSGETTPSSPQGPVVGEGGERLGIAATLSAAQRAEGALVDSINRAADLLGGIGTERLNGAVVGLARAVALIKERLRSGKPGSQVQPEFAGPQATSRQEETATGPFAGAVGAARNAESRLIEAIHTATKQISGISLDNRAEAIGRLTAIVRNLQGRLGDASASSTQSEQSALPGDTHGTSVEPSSTAPDLPREPVQPAPLSADRQEKAGFMAKLLSDHEGGSAVDLWKVLKQKRLNGWPIPRFADTKQALEDLVDQGKLKRQDFPDADSLYFSTTPEEENIPDDAESIKAEIRKAKERDDAIAAADQQRAERAGNKSASVHRRVDAEIQKLQASLQAQDEAETTPGQPREGSEQGGHPTGEPAAAGDRLTPEEIESAQDQARKAGDPPIPPEDLRRVEAEAREQVAEEVRVARSQPTGQPEPPVATPTKPAPAEPGARPVPGEPVPAQSETGPERPVTSGEPRGSPDKPGGTGIPPGTPGASVPPVDELRSLAEEMATGLPKGSAGSLYHPLLAAATERLTRYLVDTWQVLRRDLPSVWRNLSGEIYPKMTRADPEIGNLLARMVYSGTYAFYKTAEMVDRILGPDSTPDQARLWGATFTEERLRYMRQAYQRASAAASNAAANARAAGNGDEAARQAKRATRFMNLARDVTTIVGQPNSPLVDDAAYHAVRNSPEYQAMLARWTDPRVGMRPLIEDAFRRSKGIDPADPINSISQIPGRPMNLMPLEVGEGGVPATTPERAPTGTRGSTSAMRLKRSIFDRMATGSADAYEVDLGKMIEHSLNHNLTNAARAEVVRTAVERGWAQWVRPGERVDIHGKPAEIIENVHPPTGTQENERGQTALAVDSDHRIEWQKAFGKESPVTSEMTSRLSAVATFGALGSSVDAVYHTANLLTKQFHAGMNLLDTIRNGYRIIRGDVETKARLAELAQIGAMKGEAKHGWLRPGDPSDPTGIPGRILAFLDRSVRLAADDAFTRLARRGAANTEANRRNFINQVGQYNIRAQNGAVALFRDLGLGPFATAGTNYYVQGMRSLYGEHGLETTSVGADLAFRAERMAKIGALVGAIALWNFMKWGSIFGDDQTPMFSAKLWEDKAAGRTVSLPIGTFAGISRGFRQTGLMAGSDYLRGTSTGPEAGQKAFEQARNAVVHPFAGPAVQAGTIAGFGVTPSGHEVAVKANKRQGEMQWVNNLAAAGRNWNGFAQILLGGERPDKDVPLEEKLSHLHGPFGPQYRYYRGHKYPPK